MVFLYSAAYVFVCVCICFPPIYYGTTDSDMLIGTPLVGVPVQAKGISPQRSPELSDACVQVLSPISVLE